MRKRVLRDKSTLTVLLHVPHPHLHLHRYHGKDKRYLVVTVVHSGIETTSASHSGGEAGVEAGAEGIPYRVDSENLIPIKL
jgi:hypothetical protein